MTRKRFGGASSSGLPLSSRTKTKSLGRLCWKRRLWGYSPRLGGRAMPETKSRLRAKKALCARRVVLLGEAVVDSRVELLEVAVL
jgi:hypothetical protein